MKQREIKFKGWHVKSKCFFYDFSIGNDGKGIWEASYHYRIGKEAILLQCTGMKDCNEKEIWEGDIVRGTRKEKTNVGVVTCANNDKYSDCGKWIIVKKGSEYGYALNFCGFKKLEIIGNIFENPELLKDDELELEFLEKDEKPAELETIEEKREEWRRTLVRFVGENGKLGFELYMRDKIVPGSKFELGYTLDQLLNPTFEVYELVKKIIDLYVETHGSSALASSHSSHYNNALMLLAAISDCASWQEMEIWEQKYNEKYKKN